VLANYACHCTTETGEFNQISGDWAGFAADMLEADHPGAVALIVIGCGADANPSPRGTHEQAKVHGKTIADEVNRVLASSELASRGREPTGTNAKPAAADTSATNVNSKRTGGLTPSARQTVELHPINPAILCNMARIDLPLGPIPSRETWEQQAKEPGVTGSRARYFLKMLDEGQPIPTTIPNYPVQTWCFGDDLAMVFLGGEVVVDYSIRMNDMFDSDRLWINAYSNDVPCYIASARVLREGGYECDSSMLYYRRPTRLAPEAEDVLCDAVQKIMPHKFYSEKLQQDFPAPKSPEESLKTMTTKPDLRVVLAASEPLIRDPVAFDWDERGRLWVVEMGDYPKGDSSASGGRQPSGTAIGPPNSDADVASGIHTRGLTPSARQHRGRVQMLEDTDKNGVYDKATTFLDNLAFPTGIHCWRGGVIVTMAPEIFYAEDTDGDGKADVRETMYRGFVEGNQQHRVNGLRWGLDGWLYLANGDSGGEIAGTGYVPGQNLSPLPRAGGEGQGEGAAANDQAASSASSPLIRPSATFSPGLGGEGTRLQPSVSLRGRDLRINPDTNELDAVSGQTQFGRERDDFGNWFGNNNSNPIWQYVLEDRYVRRNPHAGISQVTAPVAVVPGAAPVYPTSRTLARFNDFAFANRFTSACSTMIYRDNYLGEQYYGNAFTSEPVHNLVSRLVMTRDGYGFKGERAPDEQQSEFLSSSDNWFRPTMIRTGPDGAIWVADMYRAVIEHPEWIPPEYQRKMNLYAGSDMGRIYRIVPASECCGENVAVSLRRDEPLTAHRDVEKPTAESGKPEVAVAGDSAAEQRQSIAPGVSPGIDHPNDDKAPEGRQNGANEHGEPALADEAKPARLISAERDGYFEQPWNEIPIEALVKRLESPNGWWRDTAQRILVHRADESIIGKLMVHNLKGDLTHLSAPVKVQIAATHQAIIETEIRERRTIPMAAILDLAFRPLLQDADPRVRQAAFSLQLISTEMMTVGNEEDVLNQARSDSDAGVKLALCLSLRSWRPKGGDRVLGRLLRDNFDDLYIRNAALSSLYSTPPGFSTSNLEGVIAEAIDVSGGPINEELVAILLEQAAALGRPEAITEPLKTLLKSIDGSAPTGRLGVIANLLERTLRGPTLDALKKTPNFDQALQAVREAAEQIARDESTDSERRAAALRLAIKSGQLMESPPIELSEFLSPQTPLALQLTVVELIAANGDPRGLDQLSSQWKSLAPNVRAVAVAKLMQRESSVEWILERMEANDFSSVDLDPVQRDQLIHHRNETVAARAKQLFDVMANTARSAVFDDFKSQISNLKFEISKDEQAAAGKLVFEKRCATCHRLQDIGKEVGADLAALKDRSTDALLTAILDPNKAVESKFLVYTVVTKDGLQHSGMLKGETGGSLTLIGNDGKEITVVRADIEELVGSQRSLMPEGLEKDLSATDLANVIAFVQSTGTPWKRFDGNAPKFVAANADGTVTLPASAAEIYGPSLIFEEKYGNLGYWLSADDYARWTFEVPKSGHWTVEFDFACDDSNAGSLIKFSTGNRMLTARVPGSGTWDNYQTWQAGTIDLHRGRGQLIITAPEKPPFALIDLRAVRLIPPK
jgi:putative membrane-bound dehydrogenase-like protein